MESGIEESFVWNMVEEGWRKGPWTAEEDRLLTEHVKLHGEGRWTSVAKLAGLKRNGKSCRLRWVNYLRPDLKRGKITPTEERIILEMHAIWGNRWSIIARNLPGRTDNEIKNYWRTHFKNKGKTPMGNSAETETTLLRLQQVHDNLQHQQCQPLVQAQEADMERIMSMLDENGNTAATVPQIKLDSAGFIRYANSDDEIGWLYSMINDYSTEPEAIPEDTSEGIIWDGAWNSDDASDNINYSISMNQGLSRLNSATPTY